MSGFGRNQVFKVKDQPNIATFVNLFLVEENFNFEFSISWKGITSGGIQKKLQTPDYINHQNLLQKFQSSSPALKRKG